MSLKHRKQASRSEPKSGGGAKKAAFRFRRRGNHEKEKKNEAQQTSLSIAPGVTVMATVFMGLFFLAFFLLRREGMLSEDFLWPFSVSGTDTGQAETSVGDSMVLAVEESFSGEHYFTPDFSDISEDWGRVFAALSSIRTHDRYEQDMTLETADGAEDFVVLRNEEKYRVESERLLVVCDGERVYRWVSVNGKMTFQHTYPAGERFSLKDEAGIPTVADVIADLSTVEEGKNLRFTYDNRDKVMMLSGAGDETVSRSYGISYEAGIVLSETAVTAEGEQMYRMYTTTYALDPDFPEGAFEIPWDEVSQEEPEGASTQEGESGG